MELPAHVRIRENSWRARIAAYKLRSAHVAMVMGRTIHLYGVTKAQFLGNERWVKHELKHVEQFQRYGYWNFMYRYLIESARKGYHNNRYEAEARKAENE